MQVQVMLFGPIADMLGSDTVAVDTPSEQPTARTVLDTLGAQNPTVSDAVRACRLAINHSFAHDDAIVDADDELALIGLVSGG